MSKPGHNSRAKAGPVDADRLKSFVERIERLEEERKAIGGDVKDVYAEAKGVGYDVKTMRQIVKERSQDAADRDEQEALLDVYRHALGMGTYRSVAAQYGISKSKLHRLVPRQESGTAGGQPDSDLGAAAGDETVAPATPAHDADGVVTETQESVEVGSIGVDAGRPSEPSAPAEQSVNSAPPPGLAPSSDSGEGEQPGTHSDEAPAPRSVGAVAAEPRVATPTPFMGDDPGRPPPFLIRAQAGRGA